NRSPNDPARIDAERSNQVEWSRTTTIDATQQARREKSLQLRDRRLHVELAQRSVLLGDAESLVCSAIAYHGSNVARARVRRLPAARASRQRSLLALALGLAREVRLLGPDLVAGRDRATQLLDPEHIRRQPERVAHPVHGVRRERVQHD